MKKPVRFFQPARAQAYQNLILFPLLALESGEPDYLTLEETLGGEAVVITGASEGGEALD